jgi:hypothetical protein
VSIQVVDSSFGSLYENPYDRPHAVSIPSRQRAADLLNSLLPEHTQANKTQNTQSTVGVQVVVTQNTRQVNLSSSNQLMAKLIAEEQSMSFPDLVANQGESTTRLLAVKSYAATEAYTRSSISRDILIPGEKPTSMEDIISETPGKIGFNYNWNLMTA